MIKNGKKNKIKDLYSLFQCKEMPETVNGIDGRTAVLDIFAHRNGNYRFNFNFIFFLIILYHLLDCKGSSAFWRQHFGPDFLAPFFWLNFFMALILLASYSSAPKKKKIILALE